MSGRPEAFYSDYDGGYDEHALDDFTPWRPGDPSTVHEAPTRALREAGLVPSSPSVDDEPYLPSEHVHTPAVYDGPGHHAERGGPRPGGDDPISVDADNQPRLFGHRQHYRTGDEVHNNRAIHGMVFEHVPDHTKGRVVDTETTLFGEHWATVEFDNGHTETVRPEYLDRHGLFD